MKKKIKLLISFFVILILILGCKGSTVIDPTPIVPPDPIPVVKKYTVEVTSDSNGVISPSGKMEVISGNSLNLSIVPKFGYKLDTFLVNKFPVVINGNSYSLNNVDKNYQIKATYIKTLSWYLAKGKWKCDSLANLEPTGIWNIYPIWGEIGALQFVYTFLPDGSYTLYESGNWYDSGTWLISGEDTKSPTLSLKNPGGTQVWNIEKLDNVYLTLLNNNVLYVGDPNYKVTSMRYKYSQLK